MAHELAPGLFAAGEAFRIAVRCARRLGQMHSRSLRIDVACLPGQKADKLIVSTVGGIELVLHTQMPLSDQRGVVSLCLQQLRESDLAHIEPKACAQIAFRGATVVFKPETVLI